MKKRLFALVLAVLLLSLPAAGMAVVDMDGPVLSGFTVTPDSVAVGEEIFVSVHLSDPSGLWEENCASLYCTSQIVFSEPLQLVSGDAFDGVFECSFVIPEGYSAGEWAIDIYAYDVLMNNCSQRVSFTVSGDVDTDPPAVTGITITPQEADPGDTVTVSCTISDPSGLWEESCASLYCPSQVLCSEPLQLVSGDAFDGVYECSFVIPEGYSGGEWNIDINAYDVLMNLFCPRTPFTVSGTIDTEGPVITDLIVTPALAQAGDTVHVSVRMTDAVGVRQDNWVSLYCPSMLLYSEPLQLVSGDAFDGVYECSLTIPTSYSEGPWNIDVDSYDVFMNVTSSRAPLTVYDLTGLAVLMLPDSLTEIGPGAFAGIGTQAIVIPGGCVSIAPDAFAGCQDLKSIVNYSQVTIDPIEGVNIFN